MMKAAAPSAVAAQSAYADEAEGSSSSSPTSDRVYRTHEVKMAELDRRRTKKFSEKAMKRITDVDALLETLTGDMQLPPQLEAHMWMTVASAVQEAGAAGLNLTEGDPWSLLDLVLIAKHRDDEVPSALLAELMLKGGAPRATLHGKVITSASLFEADYANWSTSDNPHTNGSNHLTYAMSLLALADDSVVAVGRAVDEFALASQVPELRDTALLCVRRVLDAASNSEVTSPESGNTYRKMGLEDDDPVTVNGTEQLWDAVVPRDDLSGIAREWAPQSNVDAGDEQPVSSSQATPSAPADKAPGTGGSRSTTAAATGQTPAAGRAAAADDDATGGSSGGNEVSQGLVAAAVLVGVLAVAGMMWRSAAAGKAASSS